MVLEKIFNYFLDKIDYVNGFLAAIVTIGLIPMIIQEEFKIVFIVSSILLIAMILYTSGVLEGDF